MPTPRSITPLYTFTWREGGYNQVYAETKREALAKAKAICSSLSPDPSSFKRLSTAVAQDLYYKAIARWD